MRQNYMAGMCPALTDYPWTCLPMNILHLPTGLLSIATSALLLATGCAGVDDSIATAMPRSSSPQPLEQALLIEVNHYRASLGMQPLVLHDILIKHARIHSADMARGRVAFGHTGFPNRAKEIRAYISVLEISENLAVSKGYDDPVAVAFQSLMASPGHRKNIEGDFDMTGIGVSKSSDGRIFFTQLFADGAGRFR